jgi:protein-tyrosine phosphatase
MIDLHNHILPDVDDGARSLQEACDMARQLVAAGVTTVCATPHAIEWSHLTGRDDVETRVFELQMELDRQEIRLVLLSGCEARITPTIVRDVESGTFPTLNGTTYLLLEFPYDSLPPGYDRLVFELLTRGVRPIIAHPERIGPLADDPNLLLALVRQGCLSQLTAASIAGAFGSHTRDVAETMLEHNLVHLVASDAHGCDERLAAIPAARQACGSRARELFEDTPDAIIGGRVVEPAFTPAEVKKRRFLGVFG